MLYFKHGVDYGENYVEKAGDIIEIVFDGSPTIPDDFYKKLCNCEILAELHFIDGEFLGVNFKSAEFGIVKNALCAAKVGEKNGN